MKMLKTFEVRTTHPWDRLENETDKAYAAFKVYLNDGSERSHQNVATQIKRHPVQVSQWAEKYKWLQRVTEYDTWMETAAQKAKEAVIAEQAELWQRRKIDECEQCYEVATLLRSKGLEMLQSPLYVETKDKFGQIIDIKPAKWNMGTCATMLKLAAELAMVAINEAQDTGDNFDPLTASPEECRAYLNVVLDRRKAMKNIGGD